MLQKSSAHTDREEGRETSPAEFLKAALGAARRQLSVILFVTAFAAAIGLVYLLITPTRYTAVATMVIDTRKVQLFQQQSVLGDTQVDAGTVQTQVEILNSENISLAVIRELDLIQDPEFRSLKGVFGALVAYIPGLEAFLVSWATTNPSNEFERIRTALHRFEDGRTIKRIGQTYVIEISVRSLSPEKAARIANAIAEAYIVDQLEAKYVATRRASVWLLDRINELRAQASAAERAVVEYKEKNNIVDTGGRLVTEQQIAELTTQLIQARASRAETKARLDRINEILRAEIPNELVADALKNETIIKLRGQYVDIASREANWSEKYGSHHLAAINLRNQMQEIRRNISQELKRIQQAYQSDYDIARARADSLKNSLENVVSETQVTNQAQVQLRELESKSQTYRTIYDNFLQRYMEAVQQQSFPITEARLISPAAPPLGKSSPKTAVVLGIAVVGGMAFGLGIAYVRELANNVFRTAGEVENALQTSCIAVVPAIKRAANENGNKAGFSIVQLSASSGWNDDQLIYRVITEPSSRFTEGVRSIKVAADLNGMADLKKVIGVTSTISGEGKSTIAASFAQLIAHAGRSVVLVDADLRKPSLSAALAPDAVSGLVDVIAGRLAVEEVMTTDPKTGLAFLPAGQTSDIMHTNELLASSGMKHVIESLRSTYDYIVLDLPPLAPVVDTRVTPCIVDSYIYVIEWGRTRVDVVEQYLFGAQPIFDRLLGVVLNKADQAAFIDETPKSHGYFRKRYGF